MNAIGKIWARRVEGGTQSPADCPDEYRESMLSSINDNCTRVDATCECVIKDIINRKFNDKQSARDSIGILYNDGKIDIEHMNILIKKVDEIYCD